MSLKLNLKNVKKIYILKYKLLLKLYYISFPKLKIKICIFFFIKHAGIYIAIFKTQKIIIYL